MVNLTFMCSCVEILINEQTRRYNQKMDEIQQLENAEAMAIKQLKLRRQNTVRKPWHARLQNTLLFFFFYQRMPKNITVSCKKFQQQIVFNIDGNKSI